MKLNCPECKRKLEIDFEFTESFNTTCPACQHGFEIVYKQKVVYREPIQLPRRKKLVRTQVESIRLFVINWFTSMSTLKIFMFGVTASVIIVIFAIFVVVQSSKAYKNSKLVLLGDDNDDNTGNYENYNETEQDRYDKAWNILQSDSAKGIQALKALADIGNSNAQAVLGDIYSLSMHGQTENNYLAKNYYLKAARQNHGRANFMMGLFNFHGLAGLNVNLVKAMKYWKVSANMGFTRADEFVKYYEPYSKIDQSESLKQKQTTAEVCKEMYELNLKLRTNGNNNQRAFYVARSRYMANLDYRYINPSIAQLLSNYIEIDTRIIKLYDKYNMGMQNTVGVTELGADLGKIAGVVTSDRYNRNSNPLLGQLFGLVIGTIIESEMKDDVEEKFRIEFETIKKQMANLDELVLVVFKTIEDEY